MTHVPEDPGAEADEDLPHLSWEIVPLRKRLPESLRIRIGLQISILRVSSQVDQKIRTSHREDVGFYENLEAYLLQWKHAIPDPKTESTWQVYIPLTDAHWLAVIIGTDRNDSVNLVSVFRIRTRNVQARIREEGA